MTKRQPTIKQAAETLQHMEQVLAHCKEYMFGYGYSWLHGEEVYGLHYRYPRHRYWDCIKAPYSDISLRCADCGDIIQDRRDNLGRYAGHCLCPNGEMIGHWKNCPTLENHRDRYCIRCANKRISHQRNVRRHNATRILINRAKGILNEQRKKIRAAS